MNGVARMTDLLTGHFDGHHYAVATEFSVGQAVHPNLSNCLWSCMSINTT